MDNFQASELINTDMEREIRIVAAGTSPEVTLKKLEAIMNTVQALVRQMGIKEGVKIDPKYGTWDSTQVSVVPPATATSTSPTPAATK